MNGTQGDSGRRRVVVVTGGAGGIGGAIAEELGRTGAYVVTLDPVVALDGSPQTTTSSEPTTAERIVAAGGAARASNTSVTDGDAVGQLFAELVDEFGALDAVVNVAGISRPTGFAGGDEDDWARVLGVHLGGYLTVLRAALPIMTVAGHGRILGVTSGSGWRAADAGAYSCAKRAVASLTWQLGAAAPPGVTINALSPIAATRMVANALARQAGKGSKAANPSGGVALGSVPPPDTLGPAAAYLVSDAAAWCRGQVVFSCGSELSIVAPPRLLEVARTTSVASLAAVFDAIVPRAFATSEAGQVSTGGGVPRFGAVFDEPGGARPDDRGGAPKRCALVADDGAWRAAISRALADRGVESVGIDTARPETGFSDAVELLTRAGATNPIDAVVVARRGRIGGAANAGESGREPWQQILDAHDGIVDDLRADAAWVRAVADYAEQQAQPMRIVSLVDATSAGGRSRAMGATQLTRAGHMATDRQVDAFAIGVEDAHTASREASAAAAAYLVSNPDVAPLAGAEFVAGADWFGLRSHPKPAGSIVYGGPAIPDWLDGALQRIVHGD